MSSSAFWGGCGAEKLTRSRAAKGRAYTQAFDGVHDIPTVEGPIIRCLESHAADYPAEVAQWYETMAREVMCALDETARKDRVAAGDALWSGPRPGEVGR